MSLTNSSVFLLNEVGYCQFSSSCGAPVLSEEVWSQAARVASCVALCFRASRRKQAAKVEAGPYWDIIQLDRLT